MGRVAIVVTTLLAGWSSDNSNNFICCIDYNGAQSYWKCPNATAEDACCSSSGGSPPGCIAQPMDPAASGCTNNASPNDCP